jgi:mono/diheme cytochrome c family protein
VAGPDLFIVLLIVFVLFGAKKLQGAKLFALNCSHCHADDATGDEGPDLHGLTKSDERIRTIITNGVKGEMAVVQEEVGRRRSGRAGRVFTKPEVNVGS